MLRHARRRALDWLRSVAPRRATLKTDALAGLPGAIGSVPDGMAASVLTGVNPVHGLYASFAGPVAGGLTASTKLMVITTTSAAALAAGSALEDLTPDERPGALFLLTLIAGAAMIAAGLLRLGRFTRFVSHSVMIGFLSGVAVNIIAGQIPDVTGAQAEGSIALQKAWDVIIHPSRIDPASLLAGAARLGDHRRARPNPDRRLQRRRRARRTDGRRHPRRCRRRPGRGPRRHPPRHSPAGVARAVRLLRVAARRSIGGRRDRARAGRRRRRVRSERRRVTIRRQRRLRRPGRRQPQLRVLPGSTGRGFGRPDRVEPDRRSTNPVGGDLLRNVDAADPGPVLRCRRGRRHAHARRAAHLRRRRLAALRSDRHDLADRAHLADRHRRHLPRHPPAPRRHRRRCWRHPLAAAAAQPGRPRPQSRRTGARTRTGGSRNAPHRRGRPATP